MKLCFPERLQDHVSRTSALTGATTNKRLALAIGLISAVISACAVASNAPTPQPTVTALVRDAPALPSATPIPATATPLIGFTPQTSQRNSSGIPLPYAPNAVNVVVTYTPAPAGTPLPKSGLASVSVGDNYFYPQEVRVTVGSTVEWDYNGGGGETESIHNVVAANNTFSSGDINPGSRFAYTFELPGEFDYVCTYHVRQMTAKVFVVQ
jgi:plastocyanin